MTMKLVLQRVASQHDDHPSMLHKIKKRCGIFATIHKNLKKQKEDRVGDF
uniref:Uncharacterized protein n=1 Tax=Rhizophora mucronata TaxID=61149 RepID=A0A2P2MLY2_RHIMU